MTLITAQAPHITAYFMMSHNKKKAIKCGAFNYSIVVNAHPFTSMADTDIDAVRKQKRQNTINNTD
jgi:Skp family chaperone for outer membrane proteins